MRFLPSGLVPFICSCLLPTLCLARLSFDVESSVEHYGGRGQCLIYRIPGNSLVTGYFKVKPNPNVRVSALVNTIPIL